MNQPGRHSGMKYETNPQAMAAVSARNSYTGAPELGVDVDRDTWLTPRYILLQLGDFDLDPCAAEASPTWVAPRYYTREVDGLSQDWGGDRVFMNPPFSKTALWLERHSRHGIGISLVPASVESVVWRKFVWPVAKAILLLHGRTRFCNPDGSATTGRPLRSIALIGWTDEDAHFLRHAGLAGVFLLGWTWR